MESLDNIRDKGMRAASGAFGKAAGTLKNLVSTKAALLLTTSILVGIVLAAIAFWIWKRITKKFVNQQSYSMQATREGLVLNKATECKDTAQIPNMTANGQRTTITFWIYLHNLDSAGSYRYIFRRGGSETDVSTGASILAFLDKDTPNKLHIRILKNGTTKTDKATPTLDNPSLISTTPLLKREKGAKYMDPYTMEDELRGFSGSLFDANSKTPFTTTVKREPIGITVPYLPIQRWVHVAVVLNEQVNGGTLTAYVDAEQVAQIKNAGTGFNIGATNTVYIGSSTKGTEGLISYLTFHNYDLNTEDIYKEYRSGPVRSIMSKLGLPAYGVRSPIYPLEVGA